MVVVSADFAREQWGDPASAVGKRIAGGTVRADSAVWRTVVGVLADVRQDGVAKDPPSMVYWPAAMEHFYEPGLVVYRRMTYTLHASPGAMAGLLPRVQEAVWSVNPNVPLADVRTMADRASKSLARTSFTLAMLAVAAAVALLLGAVGIYGVISYSVSQRRREIGVRMALGAQRADVSRMVVGQGMALTGIGVGIGVVSAVLLTRLMASLLYGVAPLDPLTYALVAATLTGVALLASWLPARRAAGMDAARTLREE